MPLAVIGWHLSQRLEDPLLVIAASPRLRHSAIRARGRRSHRRQMAGVARAIEELTR
ncbi:MAG TPA: hypothetical protein VID48_12350 [Solirubrobacteraceae bacterium]|jgi:hypothetical protein